VNELSDTKKRLGRRRNNLKEAQLDSQCNDDEPMALTLSSLRGKYRLKKNQESNN
jgi:hypothetical protein